MSGGINSSPWTVSISDCAHGGGLRGDNVSAFSYMERQTNNSGNCI